MAAGEAIAMQGAPKAMDTVTKSALVMPADWRPVLAEAGAVFADQAVSGFADGTTEPTLALSSDVMADLSHFGLIAVEGPDAQKFLASLFPGDVRLVSPTQGQFTGWCDGKGRLLTTFWLFMRGETYYLLLPQELLPPTFARLRQFQLRSKVRISDASSELVRLGLSGPEMGSRLAEILGGEPPVTRGETHGFGGCTLMALPGSERPRWLVVGGAEHIKAVWESLHPATQPVGASAWALLDILAGIPFLEAATSGEFIPQMVDLEALGGLSFTKGCYPGQEVVARLQYRGQLKRRLYLAYINSDEIPQTGAKLYGAGTTESVGMVLSAARSEPGRIAVLVVVTIDHKAQSDIHLWNLQGPRLNFPEQDTPARSEHP